MQKVCYYIRAIYRIIDKIMYFVGLTGSGHMTFSCINNCCITIEPINPSAITITFLPHLLFPDNTTYPRCDIEHNNTKAGWEREHDNNEGGDGLPQRPIPKTGSFFVKQFLIN